MLRFEIVKSENGSVPDEVQIFMDREGLRSLTAQLQFLENGRTEHIHLMSEAWGGTHLEGESADTKNTIVHHVKLMLRNS